MCAYVDDPYGSDDAYFGLAALDEEADSGTWLNIDEYSVPRHILKRGDELGMRRPLVCTGLGGLVVGMRSVVRD